MAMKRPSQRELFAARITRAATKLSLEESIDLAHLLVRAQEAKRRVRDWKFNGVRPEEEAAFQKAQERAQRYKERAEAACREAGFGLTEDLNVLQVTIPEEPAGVYAVRSWPVP